jgi:hypothetical protein
MDLMRRRCGSWPFTAGSAGSSEAEDTPGSWSLISTVQSHFSVKHVVYFNKYKYEVFNTLIGN